MSDPQAFPEGSSSESEALWKLLGTLGSTAWKLREIEKVIAAAEERGRRAGIGEAAKTIRDLKWLLRDVRPAIAQAYAQSSEEHERAWEVVLAQIDAALAPRDSGKEDGPLDKMKRALEQKTRMERERYESFCEAVAAGSPEDRAIAMATDADADKARK